MCVCVCIHTYLCVWSAYSNLLPRVLLGFLLTINFQGRYLYILKSSFSWCILITAIFSYLGDLLIPYFYLFIYYWRIIALQNVAVLCQTPMWISHSIHISPPFWTSLPSPSPSHLSRLIQSPLFEFPEPYSKFLLAIYFTYGNVSFHVTLSIHLTLSIPLCVCFSVTAL